MNKKRFLAILLSLLMLFQALPMAALFAGVAVNSLVGLLAGKPGFVE